jgi:hypothetical protein
LNREARPRRAALATQIPSDPAAQNNGGYFVSLDNFLVTTSSGYLAYAARLLTQPSLLHKKSQCSRYGRSSEAAGILNGRDHGPAAIFHRFLSPGFKLDHGPDPHNSWGNFSQLPVPKFPPTLGYNRRRSEDKRNLPSDYSVRGFGLHERLPCGLSPSLGAWYG